MFKLWNIIDKSYKNAIIFEFNIRLAGIEKKLFYRKEIVMATYVVTGDQYRVIDRRMREIKRQLDQDSGSPIDPEALANALQDIIEGSYDKYIVGVDYCLSLEEMIAACQFGWVSEDITQEHFRVNFPEIGRCLFELTLDFIHFGRNMSTDNVLKELEDRGLRPVTLSELLDFLNLRSYSKTLSFRIGFF